MSISNTYHVSCNNYNPAEYLTNPNMLWFSDNDEKRIALEVSKGSRQAMRELYSLVAGCMSSACCRYLSDDDAKDVMQDAFLKIITNINSFQYKGKGSLKAWATRIAINQALDCIKQKRKQQQTVSRTDNADYFMDAIPDEHIDDIDTYEPDIYNIDSGILHKFIRSLPEGYRTVFNLYAIEGKSHREIAGMLNIKESSSASQYHRAKALLAKKIKNHLQKKQHIQ